MGICKTYFPCKMSYRKDLDGDPGEVDGGRRSLIGRKFYKGRQGLDCYLKYFEGTDYIRRGNIEDNNAARRIAEDVITMCPESPMGYFLLGSVHHRDYRLGNTKSLGRLLRRD